MIYPPYQDIKQYLLKLLNEDNWFNKDYKIYLAVTKDLGIIGGCCSTSNPNLITPDEIYCHYFNNKSEIMNLTEEQYCEICGTLEKYYKEHLVDEKLNDMQKDF